MNERVLQLCLLWVILKFMSCDVDSAQVGGSNVLDIGTVYVSHLASVSLVCVESVASAFLDLKRIERLQPTKAEGASGSAAQGGGQA